MLCIEIMYFDSFIKNNRCPAFVQQKKMTKYPNIFFFFLLIFSTPDDCL